MESESSKSNHNPVINEPPLLTIITVSRNAEATIRIALESLADQTFADWEWIMVDSASTDATVSLAELLKGKGRRQIIISEPDTGIYNAMNKGLRAARGRYVHFLNADDAYCDARVLEDFSTEIHRVPDADFIYGNIVVTSKGHPDVIQRPPPPEGAMEEMVCGCLPHQGSFTKLSLYFGKLGMFDERLRTASDYQWMLNAIAQPEVRLHYMDRNIARYSADGLSAQLETSLPESFQVLNSNQTFQEAIGVQRMLGCYQQQLLLLRKELQIARDEKDRLHEKCATLKDKVSENREKLDKLRLKFEKSKKNIFRKLMHKWLRI